MGNSRDVAQYGTDDSRGSQTKNPESKPPRLRFEQLGPNELKFHYASQRKMAAVAKGIIKGVAQHCGNKVAILDKKNSDGSIEMKIKVQ